MSSDQVTARGATGLVLALLWGLPAAVLVARLPGLSTAPFLAAHATVTHLPDPLASELRLALFVPLGSSVLVLCRFVLGVRGFGVFSPILLALGVESSGVVLGLAFLAVVVLVVAVGVRRRLKATRTPYAARVPILLVSVVIIVLAVALTGRALGLDTLMRLALFPVIALSMVSERFASCLDNRGAREAAVRTTVTVAQAVTIAALARGGMVDLFARFPELLLAEIGLMLWLAWHVDLRLLPRLAAWWRERHGSQDPADPRDETAHDDETAHEGTAR